MIMKIIHMMKGGPTHRISVGGKIIEFEMHRYCGPVALGKKGQPLKKQDSAFLEAASRWCQQGKRIEDGLCRWDHEPEPITIHMGGRKYLTVGWKPPVKGS